jgi:hypothetical protein
MPSSNPTTGLGVAAYVQVSGVNVTPAGSLTGAPTNDPIGGATSGYPQGQGSGAVPSANHPVAQYALTLSLSGATVNGVTYESTEELSAVLKDVADNTITNGGYNQTDAVWIAYCAPAPNTEGWYRPNNFGAVGKSPAYNACVVVLGPSGYDSGYETYDADVVVTANAVGQCVIECQFPTFDNTIGDNDGYNQPEKGPIMFIYAQIVCTVIP